MNLLRFGFAVLLAAFPLLAAARPSATLTEGWKFLRQDGPVQSGTENWEDVAVPHTWNATDGANGKAADATHWSGYYRGPAWYARALDVPPEWKGKRVFLRFEAVATVAEVFVNDAVVGQHRGAMTAFCFEITPHLRFDGKDRLRVRANNAQMFDVAPLSGDFTIFGGIYRPVSVFATGEICISPLESASPGVFLTTKKIEADAAAAAVEAKVLVSNGGKTSAEVRLEIEVKDADGSVVFTDSHDEEIPAGETRPILRELQIPQPRLWQGLKDPHLYTATVRVVRDDAVLDEIAQPLGVRTAGFSPEGGFLLNGEPYPLHGVNRHQDRAEKGWALSDADHDEDFALIRELGANTVRLAHYPQAAHVHDLADRAGLILWEEIPLVDTVADTPEFLANARQQLTEMILQGWNHPSLAMWGLFNELDATWASLRTAPAPPIIRELHDLAHALDPSRPTVGASYPQDAGERHRIPDGIAWNIYPGWYSGLPDDAAAWIEKYSTQMDGRKIGLSEYGAGANPFQSQEGGLKRPKADGQFHPQEWQNYVHERLWSQFRTNPRLWGTWIWAMFDFASDRRDEGGVAGLNDKGLVTRDRRLKKDTFYFYKANWNPEPMVYLASRRLTPRQLASVEVKAYSNCAEVELRVNGRAFGKTKPDETCICVWPQVQLDAGKNEIEVIAREGEREVRDRCEWVRQ